jgi:hypothetical protein
MKRFDCRGDVAVSLLVFMMVLMALAALVGEYMRTHTMQTKVEQQLIQASNVAVEAAMHDSFRQDKEGHLDYQRAVDVFYSYLHYEMGLDNNFMLYRDDGMLLYRIVGIDLTFVETPPAISLRCTLIAPSIFTFFTGEIVVPFEIQSKNARMR